MAEFLVSSFFVRRVLMAWLDKSAARPFVWGQSDCVLESLDWFDYACDKARFEGWRGVYSPIAQNWRGKYSTEDEAYALAGGDLEGMLKVQASSLGIVEVKDPIAGDVGFVRVVGQEKALAAILMFSGRWRMKTQTGVAMTRDVEVISSWSLPCRPRPPIPEELA